MSCGESVAAGPTPRKHAELWRFAHGLGLAIAMAVIVCAQGCLVPQSVDPIVTVAHPAPHFVLESIPTYLLPPILQLYRAGSTDLSATPPCHCELELSVPYVEEDDPTVVLEARWFIDYDVGVPASVRPWQRSTLDQGFDTSGTIRQLAPFNFDADAAGIASSGIHTVEVFVGETAGYDDSPTASQPNRTMKTALGYQGAAYKFVVNVDVQQDASRPTCPTELPSLRVCR